MANNPPGSTAPITAALVGSSSPLWQLLLELGARDPILRDLVNRYRTQVQQAQTTAESQAQQIERRLRRLETGQ